MGLALESLLVLRGDGVRRFLRTAVDLDALAAADLVAAGVPHYEAADYLRRLEQAGEADQGRWVERARDGYRRLVDLAHERRVMDMPGSERPREKALRSGIEALDDAELLALLLRTGSGSEDVLALARRLLSEHDGLVGLAGQDVAGLMSSHGVGNAKAAELTAAFELGRRLRQAARRARPSLRTPEEVVAAVGPDLVALRHEEFWLLPLDVQSRLIGEPRRISRGDVDGTEAGPRVVFRTALVAGAVSCIALHNHPSGEVEPSAADRTVTQRLVAAGRVLDLPLVDHVIIGDGGRFTSLRRSAPELFR
jgi:DNA repair protein RadC